MVEPITPEPIQLKRSLGLVSSVAFVAGTIIGSGIFISPTGVASGAGSIGLSLVIWILCGIIAIIGALCYTELGLLIPTSGGEYPYLLAGLGDVISYLFAWISIVLIKPCNVGIIALTCSSYILQPFAEDGCGVPNLHLKLMAAVIVGSVMVINMMSVRASALLQNLSLFTKMAALCMIIFGGCYQIWKEGLGPLSSPWEGTRGGAGPVAVAIYNGMWAYDGWNNLNFMTEEVINPERNFLLCILIALPMVTVVYILVNVSYFTVMTIPGLLSSPAVAMTWADSILPGARWLIPVAVAISTLGSTNGSIFASGRLPYAAAKKGHMFSLLSHVHCRNFTPVPSLGLTVFFTFLFMIPANVESLLDMFSFATWMFYAATFLSLIILRFTLKEKRTSFKVPLVLPTVALAVSLFLVIAPLIDNPRLEYMYAMLFILAGLVFYVPFVVMRRVFPGTGTMTAYMQVILQCTPPPK